MGKPKITVVGAGNVGGTVAQRLAERNAYDVVLVDIVPGVPQGKALDLMQAGAIYGHDSQVTGTNSYEATAGSTVVVITSGIARKPGMTRDELLATNAKIVRSVAREVVARSPQAFLVLVTNPLDAMVHVALQASGFSRSRVIGMAGVLDSARFRHFIATELGVSSAEVHAIVLGGHGDTMVPLLRYTTVAGRPLTELLPKERLEALVTRTQNGGAEIVNFLKTGSAYYAPSASAVEMVEAIVKDHKRILPCAVKCDGEYGLREIVGVPVLLGSGGAERIVEFDLTGEEKSALTTSAGAVRELCEAVDRLMA